MGIGLVESMIKIQMFDLLRLSSVDDIYDLKDVLQTNDDTKGRNCSDADLAENSFDEKKFMDAVNGLAVPDRDISAIGNIVGNFAGAADEEEQVTHATGGDALCEALLNLQEKIERIVGYQNAYQDEVTTTLKDVATGKEDVPDITAEELQEANKFLGRGTFGTYEGSSSSGGKRTGGNVVQNGPPELRINVDVKGEKMYKIEIWPNEHSQEVAKAFTKSHGLPISDAETLARKIDACREEKRKAAQAQGRQQDILGRLEVKLRNGKHRNIVVRKNDNPALAVEAFAKRHGIEEREQKDLVSILKSKLSA